MMELWVGVECTVNRVGDRWFDQVARTGHADRLDDLDKLAALGARAVRYPVLWERTTPRLGDAPSWEWSDERLGRLRALGLRPIVGLVHHGSGPEGTDLLDPSFPDKLALFAQSVAFRYPWVCDFTPVNEPLTTARFSGLYGHWYPHQRSSRGFARMLLNQCRAIGVAMRAIREVVPDARLVQTEDMGRVFSTEHLRYQADFENERRWLSLDLLTGRVGRAHPMRPYLVASGATNAELDELEERPCPPNVVGINYYVTSDRWLDERTQQYPPWTRGGNGRDSYADVEAVRARPEGIVGHAACLTEVWQRYGLPVALTEVHLGCTREEQLRWLREAWRGAVRAREAGADVSAVTAWSAFGATDWDSLLVDHVGHYEAGIYDIRASAPRATALASLVRELAETGTGSHPVLADDGWWHCDTRLLPSVARRARRHVRPRGRPILVTGARGTVGQAIARACAQRRLAVHALSREELDIAFPSDVARAIERLDPWAIVNAAGYSRVDDAERERASCMRDNANGAAVLAEACAARDLPLVTFSSNLVFRGNRSTPYVESDAADPVCTYGVAMARAERIVLERCPRGLVLRTSSLFGGDERGCPVHRSLLALEGHALIRAAEDVIASPTYVPDLVSAALDLLIDGASGVWHLANVGETSAAGLTRAAADACGVSARALVPCQASDLRLRARRPAYSALRSERALLMPSLLDALDRFARERRARAHAGAA